MEVSQIAALDTHAIIGGERPEAFTMSESAEFFTVLSDTLYRDKKRAVVREIVCNAWDAHVFVGKTDQPIEITITDTEMVIRDFGPGIPHVKIGSTYCRYGGTTKVKDDKQTGGFGLGTKAPFAYADHFSVTSCIDGTKSVYAISRGGAETQGKPDFRRMVQVPTEETGITVSIPLRDPKDKQNFLRLAKEIATFGGMRAQINEQLHEGLNYSQARENGYCIVETRNGISDIPTALTEARVYVLYGTVLYPLTSTDDEINDALRLLPISNLPGYCVTVLVAPPGSIGVTPSRESLSYTEKTKTTLLKLLKKAGRQMKHHAKGAGREYVRKAVDNFYKQQDDKAPWYRGGSQVFNWQMKLDLVPIRALPEEIGYVVAYSNPQIYFPNRARMATLEIAKRKRDHRRVLRRICYEEPQRQTRHRLIERFVPSREQAWLCEARLFIRLASKLGLLRQLCVVRSAGRFEDGASVGRPMRCADYLKAAYNPCMDFESQLTVGFVQRDVVNSIRDAANDGGARSTENDARIYFAFVLKRNQASLIPEIEALARRYKLDPTVAELTKPPKREAPAVKNFRTLAGVSEYGAVTDMQMVESAPAFIHSVTRGREGKINGIVFKHREAILGALTNVAITRNSREETSLKKKGAIPLLAALIDKLNAIKGLREVQLAYCVACQPITQVRCDKPASIVLDVSRRNVDLFLSLVSEKTRLTDVGRNAYRLFLFLKEYRSATTSAGDAAIGDLFAEIGKLSAKSFPKYPLQGQAINKQMTWLQPLAGHWTYSLANLPDELIGDLFSVLRRRADKQPTTNQINLKEAA